MTKREKNALFEELFKRHRPLIEGVLCKFIGKAGFYQEANDILQETFIRCQRCFDPATNTSFAQWAIQAGKHLTIDRIRTARRRGKYWVDIELDAVTGASLLEIVSDDSTPEKLLLAAEQERLLLEAFEQIRHPTQRQVLLLRLILDVSHKETGRLLGIPVNSVASNLRYALKHMRRYLDKYYDREELLSALAA